MKVNAFTPLFQPVTPISKVKFRKSDTGAGEYFNCTTVRLSKGDLDRLYEERNSLTPVGGFFFGAAEVYPEDVKSLETFLEKAKKDVDTNAIFYDSWW